MRPEPALARYVMSFRLLPDVVVSRRPARLVASVGAAVACLLVAGVTAPTAIAADSASVAQAPASSATAASIAWQPCRDGFQCALLPVPLDYDNPRGPQITVSVIRLPAADPARRIGSLFLNPGGPGGSGVDIVRGLGQFLPLELRGRFDIVGFDPRGIFRSTPLRCYNTFDEAIADLPPMAFPVTRAEEEQ